MTKVSRNLLGVLPVLGVWLLGVQMLLQGRARVRSADPALRARWHWTDDTTSVVIRLTIEVIVLYAILRPHSYERS